MATVIRAANAHTVVIGGWVNPSNAFSTTNDGVFATAVSSRNATIDGDFGFPDFTAADIPTGSQIRSVTVTVNWGMTAAVTGGVLGVQLRNGAVALGTETTQTITTQQTATQIVLTGVSLADLRSASTLLKARVRCTKGNTSAAMTGNLDSVSLTVSYSPPRLGLVTKVTGEAFRRAANLGRRSGGLVILASVAVSGNNIVVNQPIPIGITATAVGPTVASHPARSTIVVVKKRHPKPRGAGRIELGLSIPAAPAGAASAALNQPIPISLSSTGDVPPALAYWGGIYTVHKGPPKPHKGRVIARKAPLKVGVVGSLSRPIPITISSTASVGIDAVVSQPIPITILATGANGGIGNVVVDQPIPIAILAATSVQMDAVLDQPIPISITAEGFGQVAVSGALDQPIVIAISATGSVQVTGTLNQVIPIGILAPASVVMQVVVDQPIPVGITAMAVEQTATATANPTIVDVLSGGSTVDILSGGSTVDLQNINPSTVDILSSGTTVNILSSESADMPNLSQPIKQGDTSPLLVATLDTLAPDGTISPDDLSGCTVVLNLKLGSKLVVAAGACTILDAVNGKVQYAWGANDTAKAGDAHAEFRSTDITGKVKRYPDYGDFIVKITPQVGP